MTYQSFSAADLLRNDRNGFTTASEGTVQGQEGRAEVNASQQSRVLWPCSGQMFQWHFPTTLFDTTLIWVQQAPDSAEEQWFLHPHSEEQKQADYVTALVRANHLSRYR